MFLKLSKFSASMGVLEGRGGGGGGGATGFQFSSYKQAVEFPQVLASLVIICLSIP